MTTTSNLGTIHVFKNKSQFDANVDQVGQSDIVLVKEDEEPATKVEVEELRELVEKLQQRVEQLEGAE